MTGFEKMAVEAVRSARVLLELGDNRGAINRMSSPKLPLRKLRLPKSSLVKSPVF